MYGVVKVSVQFILRLGDSNIEYVFLLIFIRL